MPDRLVSNQKLHLMSAIRVKINGLDYLFFGPTIHDPEDKFNVQEIEDMGLIPMSGVCEMLDKIQTDPNPFGSVQ